jgi:hypothetical protein
LGRIHAQLSAIEHTVEDKRAYDEAYWQLEHERQVFQEILEDWQRWFQDTESGQEKDTND